MINKETKLKVVESLQDDAYKGIARIDENVMKELNITRGDVISITGARETIAIADRAYPADIGEGTIRIDGVLRKNAKTGIGEIITIKKSEVVEAKKVIIAPAQKGIIVQESGGIKKGLLGRAMVKGDIIMLGGVQRRRDLLGGDMPEELGGLNEMLGGLMDNMTGNLSGGITQIKFIATNITPNKPVIITENTEVTLSAKPIEVGDEKIPEINYEDIGGLTEEIKKIREMVEIPMKHPEIFEKLGVEPPKGVLLHGPPGTGKTLLAKAVATETEANFILLNGPEIMSKFYGESEKKIRDIFDEAQKTAPTIIFIDEIDAIAPKREDVNGEVERRVVSQILTMMDGLKNRGRVIVVGATNRVNALDPALRRPGRFDREIEIGVPGKKGRTQVLKIHARGMPLDKSVDINKLASLTHGFVGADLESLTKEAAMNVLRQFLPKLKLGEEEKIPTEILEKLIIKQSDFMDALKSVRPSAMREILVETPNTSWDDIGGLDKTKQELKEAVEWPMKYPESFTRMGIRPSKGILLYGPPGTGKTLLAKAIAKESEANFIQIKGPSLLSKWVNNSHKGIEKIFEKARQVSPCIILIDEIESVASKRNTENASGQEGTKVLNQLLSDMDGLEDLKEILIIGTTNRPDMLDPAIMRPGRFDKILLVNAPEESGREKIIEIHTQKMPLGKDNKKFEKEERTELIQRIAKKTVGYTGADIENLVRESAMTSLRESMDSEIVTEEHFEIALKKTQPSVSDSTIKVYKKVEENFIKSAKGAIPQEQTSYLS
jgi:transitional endoplasmic reticulum ATPase